MPLTSYLDVISLATAKTYLRIDDTQSETDAEITNMIKSSLRFVEKHTNQIMYEREFVYNVDQNDKYINVYDYPIQSVTAPADSDDFDREDKTLYSQFTLDAETLTLQIGFEELVDVPTELIDAALGYLKMLFYQHENPTEKFVVPQLVWDLIDVNRRFII